jgi:hypothetical protein
MQLRPKLMPAKVTTLDPDAGAFDLILASDITESYENSRVPLPTIEGIDIIITCPEPTCLPPPIPPLTLN